MLRIVLRASQICACRRMLPLPLPLVRHIICLLLGYLKWLLSILNYVATVLDNVASGQLQRNGDSAERLWKLLWQTGNTPWMHKDRDQVPQYQYHGDWRCLIYFITLLTHVQLYRSLTCSNVFQGSLVKTFHAISPWLESRWRKSSSAVSWN